MKITNLTWQTKNLPIKNKTVRVLSNGKVIPTWLAMTRAASKI